MFEDSMVSVFNTDLVNSLRKTNCLALFRPQAELKKATAEEVFSGFDWIWSQASCFTEADDQTLAAS